MVTINLALSAYLGGVEYVACFIRPSILVIPIGLAAVVARRWWYRILSISVACLLVFGLGSVFELLCKQSLFENALYDTASLVGGQLILFPLSFGIWAIGWTVLKSCGFLRENAP